MKRFSRHLWMAALVAAICPAAASAQTYAYQPMETAGGVIPASAMAATTGNQGCGPVCASCSDCGDCCNGCCGCGCFGLNWPCGCKLSDLGEAWKLHKPCCEESQWSTTGWLDQNFNWNFYSPRDRFNGPVTWTDRSNDWQMQELWYGFGRVTKTEGCGTDWGMRVDAFYGTNYRWDTSAGFETHWGSNGSFYGIAVPNAYLEGAYNDWTVRAGRFVSPVGYYTVGSPNNFFPVIPYTYQYGEPFTHTGVWALNKLSDQWTVGGAITHGWDDTDNTGNPHAGGLLNATWTIDENRSLAWVGVIGNEPNLSGVNAWSHPTPLGGPFSQGYTARYFQTLVYTRKFSDDVMGVLQSDFGTQHDAIRDPGGNLRTAKWYGLNGYMYWNMTCRCQWGLNGEWFRDQGGFRVGQVLPSFGSPNGRGLARANFDGSFYRLTFGPRYYFTPNMYTRIAFLWDWYDGKKNGAGQYPFDDGTKNYQQMMVFDLVSTF
jgi:Putative beta-barrel porin-2, OmpL-like. bbp2